MPILRGALTFARFRVRSTQERPKDVKRWLSKGLRARAFEPIERGSEEDRSAGFVELENEDSTELSPSSFLFGEYVLVSYRVDRLRVPASALKAELEAWTREFTKDKGRPPRKPERAEQRETVMKRLRSRALPVRRTHDVSWSLKTDCLEIWALPKGLVDEIVDCLSATFDLELTPIRPSTLMEGDLTPTPELFGEANDG
jgi:DNA recombination-dependent growth factor C